MSNKLKFYEKIFENLKDSKETIIIKILKDEKKVFNKKDYLKEDLETFDLFYQNLLKKEIEKLDENSIIFLDINNERASKEKDAILIIFLEKVIKKPKLFIFGSGHCGFVLAKIAHMCSFDTYLIDDRDDYFKIENIDKTVTCIKSDFDTFLETFKKLNIEIEGLDSYSVIVTRGHKHDKTVVEKLIDKKLKYIGMIGSKRKVLKTFEDIQEKYPHFDRTKIHSPIGLNIGAKTPEEIAISILAEILMIKNQKDAKSLNLIGE
jgi:xanthine dehydrogenase accessory factor